MGAAWASLEKRLQQPARFDVVGLGEASADEVWLLDAAPPWGGKVRARGRERIGGGQVATCLVACRRLGLTCAWIGKLGDDPAGHELSQGLQAEGVEVRAKVVRGAASHSAAILVDARGQRTVLWAEDDRIRMTEADVDGALVAAGRVVHVDGNHLEASRRAAELGREAGRVVSCDLDRLEPGTADLLALCDLAVVAPELALEATGERDPARAARRLGELAPNAALVVVTLGPEGAAAWDGERVVRAAAFGGLPVIDTTACGDTFRAGLIAALIERRDLGRALAFANAAAALKARDYGRRGCPVRAEVEALLEKRAAP